MFRMSELARVARRRLKKKFKGKKDVYTPPKIIESPLEALVLRQAGKKVAFHCPVDLCRDESGLSFSSSGWHAFVATLQQYGKNKKLSYKDSVLAEFYEKWQPANAGEAIVGMAPAPGKISEMPAYGLFLSPWKPVTPEELEARIDQWTKEDNLEHGRPEFDWKKNGLKFFGPVSDQMIEFEFNRLVSIYEALESKGYDRQCGDIGVVLLRHEGEYRFLIAGGGRHRVAAMAALGYGSFPAQYIVPQFVVDSKDAQYWPQVKSGMWTCDEALAYMDYLFSFDSRSWSRGLLG